MAVAQSLRARANAVFNFPVGRHLERRYAIGDFIGSGYEGEVYHLTERSTNIERVVKFYYPHRYPNPKRWVRLAQKLHRLKDCSVVLQYHHHGQLKWHSQDVDYMVSELAHGRVLYDLLEEQRRKRFTPFEALGLTFSIAQGVAEIHARREYHGDIHGYNVLVQRYGIGFRVKLLDLYLNPKRTFRRGRGDVFDIISLLYELVGGPAAYSDCPRIIKDLVCGKRRQVIARKFPNAGALRDFMLHYEWPEDR